MKRRVICGLLVALMLIGMIPAVATQASAAAVLTTSEKAIAVLKELEGFSAKAHQDNGQYSIGYGTSCKASDYPNGITEKEADALLRASLATMEPSINKLASDNKLTFTQNEFDALMLFTYNVGTAWTKTDGYFRTAVIQGKTGNDFIHCMTLWCKAGSSVLSGLVSRRLAEADMYLNGYYAKQAPENFTYVLFDANGGSTETAVQGYDATMPVAVKATAAYTGYRFLGWYTAATGGEWITHLDDTTKGQTLYAHWQKDEGQLDENGNVLGQSGNYERVADQVLTVFDGFDVPGNGEEEQESQTIAKGSTITVVADYIDSDGVKWGRLKDGGWVDLTNTSVELTAAKAPVRPAEKEDDEPEEEKGVEITVTVDELCVRSEAGTNSKVLSSVKRGKKLTITEVVSIKDVKWGKCSAGWVCLQYTDYEVVSAADGDGNGDVIATGIITASNLCVRRGPGTNYEKIGVLPCGSEVKIYEQKTIGTTGWGRTAAGWICLTYVHVTPVTPAETEKPDETTPEETKPEESKPEESKPQEPETTGTVGIVTASELCIRSGAGTNNKVLGTLRRGAEVTITEQTVVNGMKWGKMDKGWISLSYVQLVNADSGKDDQTGTGTDSDSTVKPDGTIGIVTASELCIRSGAGTNNKVLGTLRRGAEVTITEQTVVNGMKWGKMDKGWISLSYVQLVNADSDKDDQTGNDTDSNTGSDSTDKPAEAITGKVIASSLCVRSGPGTGYAPMKALPNGTQVTILDEKLVNGTLWGQIAGGWICMSYVQLDSGSSNVTLTGTITASSLCIRSAAGAGNAILGTYFKGATVKILETTMVNGTMWGRTERGWICMTYVK